MSSYRPSEEKKLAGQEGPTLNRILRVTPAALFSVLTI